jgi:MYXO-CTERM domain-containing protein
MQCIADADMAATRTGALSPDTDRGGVLDGVEDVNKNGRVDPAELNPNDPSDDVIGKPCVMDSECGKMDSGLVCDMLKCAFGCRGMGGNTCPPSLFCSSTTMAVGMCSDMAPPPPDAGMPMPPVDAGPMLAPGGRLGGAGCNCRVTQLSSQPTAAGMGLFVGALVLAVMRRRRKRQ